MYTSDNGPQLGISRPSSSYYAQLSSWAAVAVRRAHHGNLDALIAQSSDTSGPFSFDRGPPFELKAELAKEIYRPSEVFNDDSYVVHPLERHVSNLQGVVRAVSS
jgi:hypothetical protein